MHAEYVRYGLEATVNMISTNIKDLSGVGTQQRNNLKRWGQIIGTKGHARSVPLGDVSGSRDVPSPR